MIIANFWKSFYLTFTMLMAVGPICLTVINTVVSRGFKSGLYAGSGVVLADSIYILIAGLALEIASEVIKGKIIHLFAIGGSVFIVYIAYKFWTTDIVKIHSTGLESKKKSNLSLAFALFLMTISGPTTVFTYAAVFSNFINKSFDATSVITGAICGTTSFYIVLVSLITLIRKKMTIKLITVLNKLASLIILIFGFVILKSSIIEFLK